MSALAAAQTARSRGGRWPWISAGAVLAGCAAVGLGGPSGGLLPPCPFRAITGLDCPGCGLTRGVRELVRLHPGAALDHNALLVVIVPLALWAWLGWAGLVQRGPARVLPGWVMPGLVALAFAFAVARNLPVTPLNWLGSGR